MSSNDANSIYGGSYNENPTITQSPTISINGTGGQFLTTAQEINATQGDLVQYATGEETSVYLDTPSAGHIMDPYLFDMAMLATTNQVIPSPPEQSASATTDTSNPTVAQQLALYGYKMQLFGNSFAESNASYALTSSFMGYVPGVIAYGDAAAVGDAVSLSGSLLEYVGGLLQNSRKIMAHGIFSATQNMFESILFEGADRYGFPGFPLGFQDPSDALVEDAVSAVPGN